MKRNAPAHGVECPECGGHRTAVCNSHRDEEGNRIRLRGCQDCGHYFGTVEVHVPGFSFHRAKASRDRWQRTTREYIRVQNTKTAVRLVVVPGVPINKCRRGLHEMTGDNVYVQPKRGTRACKACMRAQALLRYHYARQHAPESILEDQRRYWREQDRKKRARRKAA